MSLELAFVLPGWYKYKHTSDETIQTIRVLGEGEKPNYFKLMDGKEIHESEILNNWVYMPTSPDGISNSESFQLGDLTNITNENNFIENENENENNFIEIENEIIVNKNIEKNIQKDKIISTEEIFVNELLNQISVNKDIEIFGEKQFKNNFIIPIEFNFNYDLNKLKKILSIINTNDKKINLFVDKIISNDINSIKKIINDSVKNFLINNEDENENEKQNQNQNQIQINNTKNYLNNII
jgi:hypothetical protein